MFDRLGVSDIARDVGGVGGLRGLIDLGMQSWRTDNLQLGCHGLSVMESVGSVLVAAEEVPARTVGLRHLRDLDIVHQPHTEHGFALQRGTRAARRAA